MSTNETVETADVNEEMAKVANAAAEYHARRAQPTWGSRGKRTVVNKYRTLRRTSLYSKAILRGATPPVPQHRRVKGQVW